MDWDAPLTTHDDFEQVEVPPILCPLTDSELEELQRTVQPTASDSDYGIGCYMEVVHFIQSRI